MARLKGTHALKHVFICRFAYVHFTDSSAVQKALKTSIVIGGRAIRTDVAAERKKKDNGTSSLTLPITRC